MATIKTAKTVKELVLIQVGASCPCSGASFLNWVLQQTNQFDHLRKLDSREMAASIAVSQAVNELIREGILEVELHDGSFIIDLALGRD